MRIGLSIDQNNINTVLVNDNGMIVHQVHSGFTSDMNLTLKDNLAQLLTFQKISSANVYIGTTLVRDMLKEVKACNSVGVIRLAGHKPDIVAPCLKWTPDWQEYVLKGYETINGGFEFNGRPITPLQESEVIAAAKNLVEKGAEVIVVCGVFSTFYNDQEIEVQKIIEKECGVTALCSYASGIRGFVERENAAILNAALRKPFAEKFGNIKAAFKDFKTQCQIYFTQNNRSIIGLEEALDFPLKVMDSAIINSFVGATKLMHKQNALVINIGENYCHAGLVDEGQLCLPVCHRTMGLGSQPDLHTIEFGLNSLVHLHGKAIEFGPECMPSDVMDDEGQPLTLKSALFVCAGKACKADIDAFTACQIIEKAEEKLVLLCKRVNSRAMDYPLVLVGNASPLFPYNDKISIPSFSQFASAYGAVMIDADYCVPK